MLYNFTDHEIISIHDFMYDYERLNSLTETTTDFLKDAIMLLNKPLKDESRCILNKFSQIKNNLRYKIDDVQNFINFINSNYKGVNLNHE